MGHATSIVVCRRVGGLRALRRVRCAGGVPQAPLFYLTGASGSGKTTIVAPLRRQLPERVVLEHDVLLREEIDWTRDDWHAFRSTWLRLAMEIGQSGRAVVLCGTTWPDNAAGDGRSASPSGSAHGCNLCLMDRALTLDDLVANRTMSREIATALRAAVRDRRSFLVMAVPRLAGKSTVMRAMLAHARRGRPVRALGSDGDDVESLLVESRGGYLVIPEISRGAWAPGYVWGPPVRRAFRALSEDVALATALHAPDVAEAFAIICGGNRVPDEQAARLTLVVYLRSLGRDWSAPDRRVVDSVHEIVGVHQGRPQTRLLHRWDERADRFEVLS